MSGRGAFITIEGGEGVGKSTQARYLLDQLQAAGVDAIATREPGGTPAAEAIRELVLNTPTDGLTELLLMFAARASHVEAVIRPALEAGRWVLCDRFIDATWAYQGGGRQIDPGWIQNLERLVLEDLQPDRTLLLVATPEVIAARRRKRGETDRFEREDQAFFSRVQAAYEERARNEADRFRIIDTSGAVEDTRRNLDKMLNEFLEYWREKND